MDERLLITGIRGFLGSTIAQMAASDFEVSGIDLPSENTAGVRYLPLDIRERRQVVSAFREVKPGWVIHAAALVNVDHCQGHAEDAWMANVEGTENVAIAAGEVGAKLVYISTDSVFDGEKGMYTEEDEPNPINVYARTKLEGEERVRHHLASYLIVRTAFYGRSKSSLAEWVITGLRQNEPRRMFTDVFFTPIFVGNLVEAIIDMHREGLSGIYHVGGSERCSKYEFGMQVAEAFGLDKKLIEPVSIEQARLIAPRPKDASLNVTKAAKAMSTGLLGVSAGIARIKDEEVGRQ